jgi:hypothetical protein
MVQNLNHYVEFLEILNTFKVTAGHFQEIRLVRETILWLLLDGGRLEERSNDSLRKLSGEQKSA